MAHTGSVTFSGRSILVTRLRGTGAEPLNIGWGTGTATGHANSDVNLFVPGSETRVAGTSTGVSTSFLADTYQVTGAITAAGAKTITEVGLFDTTTLSGTATLAASITASATSATLSATIGPTTLNFYGQVGNECVLVTGGQNTSVLTITRAQLGSTAAIQASGSSFTVGGDGGARASFTLGGQTATVAAAQGGNMFAAADFAGLALNTSDSILFTITDQFSGA
jgi:hypothetical protein